MKRLLAVAALLGAAVPPAAAQTVVEVRGSTTRYRFVDLNHTLKSGVMLDALYLGVPGQNELYLGGGYTVKLGKGLTVVPLLYFVAGKEQGERAIAPCVSVLAEAGAWKAIAFAGRVARVSGGVATYDFADSIDVTRRLAGRWDAGASSTIDHLDTGWSHQTGPLLRRSDARGSWSLALRFGTDRELRLVRVLSFGAP